MFLGCVDGAPRFAIALDSATIEALQGARDFAVTDLRSIAVRGLLDADHLPPLAEGKALLDWHARHRFCANCGAPTQPVEAGWRRDCADLQDAAFSAHRSGRHHAGDRRRALPAWPFAPFPAGMWSCLAGFVEPGETIEDAVRREVHEEAGIVCGRVRLFRLAAMAVSELADDRLPRRRRSRARSRSTAPSLTMPAGSNAKRSR